MRSQRASLDSRQKTGAVLGDCYEALAELGAGGFSAAGKLGAKLDDKAHTRPESRCTPASANSAFFPIVNLMKR